MFQKAIRELRGDEVLARDGRIGTVDDIYFDGESWQGRYLAVATAGGDPRPARWLISVACVAAGARVLDRVHMELSCAQLEYGGGLGRSRPLRAGSMANGSAAAERWLAFTSKRRTGLQAASRT